MNSNRDDDLSGPPSSGEATIVQGQTALRGPGGGAAFVLERGVDSQGSPPLTFIAGQKHGPVSLGRGGEFRIDGRGVLVTHGYLMFDGEGIYLCSADEASPLVVEGERLPRQWIPVSPPCTIVLGRARAVLRPAAVGAASAPDKPVPAPPPRARHSLTHDSSPAGASNGDSIPDDASTPHGGVALVNAAAPEAGHRPRLTSQSDDESTRIGDGASLMGSARGYGDEDSTRMTHDVARPAAGRGPEMQRPAAGFAPPIAVQPYVPPMPPGMVAAQPLPGATPPGYEPVRPGYAPPQAPFGAAPQPGYSPSGYAPQPMLYGGPPPGYPPQPPYGPPPPGYPVAYPPPAGAYLPQAPGYLPAGAVPPGALVPSPAGAPVSPPVAPPGGAGPPGLIPDAMVSRATTRTKLVLPPAAERSLAWLRASVAPGSPKRTPVLIAGCSLVAIFVATLVTVVRLHASNTSSNVPPPVAMPSSSPTPPPAAVATVVSPGTVVYPAPPRSAVDAGYDVGGKSTGKAGPPPPPTLERSAVDAINRGDYLGALPLYKQLAKEQPDNPAFANAVRLIQQKLGATPEAP